jgi:hypothetical protein
LRQLSQLHYHRFFMNMIRSRGQLPIAAALLLTLVGALTTGCSSDDPKAPPMATPSVTLSPARVPLGNPVEMTYKFVVAPDAKFTQDYRVMVHFIDQNDSVMYMDDHDPPVPTTAWKPGQTIEYKRQFFTPVYPYIGGASIELGLYCKGCELRAPLAGADVGHRSYTVAQFTLLPQSDGVTVQYRDGWYQSEGSDTAGEGSWHWTRKDATLAVKNPKKDSVLYLKVGNPGGPFKEPQHVTVSLEGGAPIDSFTVAAADPTPTLRTVTIPASAWGARDTAELHLSVDKVWVPNQIAPSFSDPRELGVRVFRAVVVPTGS